MRRWVPVLIVTLLVLKVIGVVARGPSPMIFDAGSYWELGEVVANGDWLLTSQQIAYRTPAYPWFLAMHQSVSPSPLLTLIIGQAILWLLTMWMVATMAADCCDDPRAKWITLAIAVVMVSSVVYVTTTLTETLFIFGLVAHLWSFGRFTRSPSVLGGALVGATLGLTILTRPIAMLVWIADAIYLLSRWYWIPDPKATHLCRVRGWISIGVAVIVTLASVAPWLMRNHAMYGKAMLTEFVGRNIWIVAFQDGSGSGFPLPDSAAGQQMRQRLGEKRMENLIADKSWRHTWTMSNALRDSGLDDPSADRLMKQVALDAIKNDPADYLSKTLRRTINFWRTKATDLPPQVADLSPEVVKPAEVFKSQRIWGVKNEPIDTALRYRYSNWLTGNTILMLLTGASTMLLIGRRASRPVGLWLGAVLAYFCAVTAVLEIPDYRYRMIVEPIVLLVIVTALFPLVFKPSTQNPTSPDQSA